MANDHMSNNSASMDQEFHDKYTVKMIRNGRLTTLIAALLTLVPPLYLWLVVGFKPTWGQIGAGWSIMFSAYFLLYFFEPLGFYPQMGLSGIYIGYLAGNIPSVRLPAMLAAQSATGCEAGTKRGELVAPGTPIMSLVVMSDAHVVLNIREDLMPQFKMGGTFKADIPALGKKDIEFRIYYISPLGSFATWKSTKQTGSYDMQTFEIHARPVQAVEGLRPGMSAIVNKV